MVQGGVEWEEEKKKLTFVEGINNVGVRGENFSAIFAKGSPGMVSYVYAGEEMLKSVPLPNFWRAPVDNDIMKVRSLTWQSIWCPKACHTVGGKRCLYWIYLRIRRRRWWYDDASYPDIGTWL